MECSWSCRGERCKWAASPEQASRTRVGCLRRRRHGSPDRKRQWNTPGRDRGVWKGGKIVKNPPKNRQKPPKTRLIPLSGAVCGLAAPARATVAAARAAAAAARCSCSPAPAPPRLPTGPLAPACKSCEECRGEKKALKLKVENQAKIAMRAAWATDSREKQGSPWQVMGADSSAASKAAHCLDFTSVSQMQIG